MKNFSTVVGWLAVGASLCGAGGASAASAERSPGAAPIQLVTAQTLALSARIVASHDGRTLLARGDRVWVRALPACGRQFQVIRLGPALGVTAGAAPQVYQASTIGQARLMAPVLAGRQLQAVWLTASTQEIALGDYLLPLAPLAAGCAP